MKKNNNTRATRTAPAAFAQSAIEFRPSPIATLAEVLQPRPAPTSNIARNIRPLRLDGAAAEVVQAAGDKLHALYLAGVTRAPYNPDMPEVFWGQFASTALVEINAVDSLEDEQTAAIAVAIFKASGWYAIALRPTLDKAQAAITAFVIETAHNLRKLFVQEQLSFDLA